MNNIKIKIYFFFENTKLLPGKRFLQTILRNQLKNKRKKKHKKCIHFLICAKN